MIKKLYIDFDGTIVNTMKAIIDLYNEDFQYYKNFKKINWIDINTYYFDECNCATSSYISTYFNQQRFFDRLEYLDNAKEVLDRLSHQYEIIIVSSGFSPNLRAKEIWIKDNIPYAKFIGVNLKMYSDKSHIDMSDGIFIDDSSHNITSSNAKHKICFGEVYDWNKYNDEKRCLNWYELEKYIYEVNN